MFTNCVLVGKVKEVPVVETSAKGNTYAHVMIGCERSFPNADGRLMSDVFRVVLWKGIAEEMAAACRVGSLIAIKGRLESHSFTREDKEYWIPDIIAERARVIAA